MGSGLLRPRYETVALTHNHNHNMKQKVGYWIALFLVICCHDLPESHAKRFGGGFRSSGGTRRTGGSFGRSGGRSYRTMSGRPRTSLYSRSSYYGGRQSVNSNGFGIGLGVGMLLGYRSGFLARPYSNTHGYNTYEDIHRREKYNNRKDGLLECAVANTTVYVKKLINIQDVESQEDAKLCHSGQDVCYGKLTIAEVNLTISDGSKMDLIEVQIQKGCANLEQLNLKKLGNYIEERKCWTTSVQSEIATMTDSYGIGLPMTTEYGELNVFDFSGTEGMEKELELSGDISSNSKINWQQETCICDLGDRCNFGSVNSVVSYLLLIVCTFLSNTV